MCYFFHYIVGNNEKFCRIFTEFYHVMPELRKMLSYLVGNFKKVTMNLIVKF